MKVRGLRAALMALLLVIPAASAYGAEPANQEVNVHILPADALAISVDQWAEFGGMVPNETRHYDFWLNVVNTTAGGWEVTVTGEDLTSFDWGNCDESGCYNPIPSDPLYTIPKSALVVTGGDLDWWGEEDPSGNTVRPFSGTPGDIAEPLTIVQATSYAHGEFGLDNPQASLDLTIPADAQPMQMYRTVLVYTIAPWTAP
jgi:hypothetical protein